MATKSEAPRSAVSADIIKLAESNRQKLVVDAPNPFLTGIHTPVSTEFTLEDLPVTGTIPDTLSGRYVRIGPNPVAPDPKGYHWFTGDGMLHAVAIENGRATWYRNRWIRSKPVAAALGEAPAPGPRVGRHDTVNTHVIGIGDRTWALVEAGSYPVSMSDALDDQTYDGFGDTLKGTYSAHPHRDPATGNLHAIAYEGGDFEAVRHIVVSPEGRVLREQRIAAKNCPSIHDCTITSKHVLILDLPVTFSVEALVGGQRFPFRWNLDHKARIGVLPFDGDDSNIVWCDIDPCYVFHTGNAFENADGTITLDVLAYESMFDGMNTGPEGQALGIERWTIDLQRRTVSRVSIDRSPQEFPRYNEAYTGQPYSYLYTIETPGAPEEPTPSHVYKHDVVNGTREAHDFGDGAVVGEFVFVARDGAVAEDDGWLIGFVLDAPSDKTDLVFLDASNIAADPVARVHLPHRVPPGFHGSWIAAN